MNILFLTLHTLVIWFLCWNLSRKAHQAQGRSEGFKEALKLIRK